MEPTQIFLQLLQAAKECLHALMAEATVAAVPVVGGILPRLDGFQEKAETPLESRWILLTAKCLSAAQVFQETLGETQERMGAEEADAAYMMIIQSRAAREELALGLMAEIAGEPERI